jgi:hypothetical protein
MLRDYNAATKKSHVRAMNDFTEPLFMGNFLNYHTLNSISVTFYFHTHFTPKNLSSALLLTFARVLAPVRRGDATAAASIEAFEAPRRQTGELDANRRLSESSCQDSNMKCLCADGSPAVHAAETQASSLP